MTNTKLFFYGISLLITCQFGYAQTKKIDPELDSLHTAVKQAQNPQVKAEKLLEVCHYFSRIKNYNADSLSLYSRKIIQLAKTQNGLEKPKVVALTHLSNALSKNTKTIDSAKHYAKIAKDLATKLDYTYGKILSYRSSGIITFEEGERKKSIEVLDSAYTIAKDPENNFPKHIILPTILDLSDYLLRQAKTNRLPELLLVEGMDMVDAPKVTLEDKALLNYHIARMYDYDDDRDKWDVMVSYFEKAVRLFDEDHNTVFGEPKLRLAHAYNGNIRDFKKAIKHYKELLALGLKEYDVECYAGLGGCYYNLKNYDASIKYYKKVLTSVKTLSNSDKGTVYISIGEAYQKTNNTKEAARYFKRAEMSYMDAIAKNDNRFYNVSFYKNLAKIYRYTNDNKKSLTYLKKHANAWDSLFMRSKAEERRSFAFFKADNEKEIELAVLENQSKIAALKAEKEKITNYLLLGLSALAIVIGFVLFSRYRTKQRAYTTIKQKNDENTLLMQEIHHRVKNNLQVISSLLGAKINSVPNDATIRSTLQESQNKIESMALIHQNLYQSNQFVNVSVHNYINELIAQIKNSFTRVDNSVHFQLDVPSKDIKMTLAVPLGLMINELATNAYKYAFTDQHDHENKISISFTQLEETSKYRLIVEDNGKGIPVDFNVNNSTSFGLQLVYGLASQLHGEVIVTQNNGTRFDITLEEPHEK